MKKKTKSSGKHHGKGHGQGASHSSPTSTSTEDDPFAPSTSTQLRSGFDFVLHFAVLQEFLESLLRHAQDFLTHVLPRIHEAMPSNLQEAAVKGAALASELWHFVRIHYERLAKLLFHILQESRAYGEILLSDAAQYATRTAWPAAKRMKDFVFQLGALSAFFVVDSILRFTLSLLSLGAASLLFCLWCLVFGLASFLGWLAFSALFVLLAGWTFVVNFWIPLVLLGCLCIYAVVQCGLVLASCCVAALAGVAYAAKLPGLGMLAFLLFATVESYWASGLVRILVCLLLSAVSLEVLYLVSSSHDDSSHSYSHWKQSARSGTGTRSTPRTPMWSFGFRFPKSASAEKDSGESQERGEENGEEEEEEEEESSSSGAGSKDMSPEMVARREITRIIRCKHHYAVLQVEMYAEVDAGELKKDYRKKAILVHPDKNSGNEKRAREAFQCLQSAFEVLSDPEKKKEYDEELRHKSFIEMLKNRGRESSQNSATSGVTRSSSSTSTGDAAGPEGSIRMGCTNCLEGSHIWLSTTRRKAQARWCQLPGRRLNAPSLSPSFTWECKVYHAAKEGEGWMEQHPVPAMFGLLSTNGPVQAFTCSEGKIYDVTEWVDCEGLRCPVNTHKPTFTYKPRTVPTTPLRSKGSTGSRGSPPFGSTMPEGFAQGAGIPEDLSEEEMLDFLSQAVNAGLLDAETLLEALRRGAQSESQESQQKKSKPSAKRRGKGRGHH